MSMIYALTSFTCSNFSPVELELYLGGDFISKVENLRPSFYGRYNSLLSGYVSYMVVWSEVK